MGRPWPVSRRISGRVTQPVSQGTTSSNASPLHLPRMCASSLPTGWVHEGQRYGKPLTVHSPPDITVQEMDADRAVVTLGAWPEAGDTEQGQHLPLHRELARVLEPWRHHERYRWHEFSAEDMRRWERRFLD
ncbi:type VI immunity family protein [Archangium gephyra]|uniref:type VI immunity family protein n=1 Tax=Archangium gephyra TaxID=48 RepID=UPI003B7AAB01